MGDGRVPTGRPHRGGLHRPVVGHGGGRTPTARALMRAVIWMDSRGNARDPPGGRRLGQRPRLRPAQAAALGPGHRRRARACRARTRSSHILFIREAFPDVYARTATFLEPVDYLNLTADRTDVGLVRLHRRPLGHRQPGPSTPWPTTTGCSSGPDSTAAGCPTWCRRGPIMGERDRRRPPPTSGSRPACRWSTGSGDVHSAVFGSGAVADFAAHLYIGTSSWISGHVPFKKTAPTSNVASIPAAPGRPVPHRRRARDGRRLPDLPAGQPRASPRTSRP